MSASWPSGAAGRLLVLTDSAQLPEGETLLQRVQTLMDAGARAVLLRERQLPPDVRARWGQHLAEVVAAVDGVMLWASPVPTTSPAPTTAPTPTPITAPVAGHGWHDPSTLIRAQEGHSGGWRGASVHGPGEMSQAVAGRYDYATVSPWALTASKPGYGPPLGVQGTSELISQAHGMRCYALGGVTPADCAPVRQSGAYGVAVMGDLMRCPDPGRRTQEFLSAIADAWGP